MALKPSGGQSCLPEGASSNFSGVREILSIIGREDLFSKFSENEMTKIMQVCREMKKRERKARKRRIKLFNLEMNIEYPDDVLDDAETKEEMKNWLTGIPGFTLGVALKFSGKWFRLRKASVGSISPTYSDIDIVEQPIEKEKEVQSPVALEYQSSALVTKTETDQAKIVSVKKTPTNVDTLDTVCPADPNEALKSERLQPGGNPADVTTDDETSKSHKSKPYNSDQPLRSPLGKNLLQKELEPSTSETDANSDNSSSKHDATATIKNVKVVPSDDNIGVAKGKDVTVAQQSVKADNETCTELNSTTEASNFNKSLPESKKCPVRPFGVADFKYVKGNVLEGEENKQIEFKALTGENTKKLPWKIMERARPFICGVLNAGGQGTIYFGVVDSYDKSQGFKRGEIIGLAVEELKDEITKAFQFTLNDHIKSNDGMLQKGGEMDCIKMVFVPVYTAGEQTGNYIIEIDVKRDWRLCKEKVYYFQKWTAKRGKIDKEGLSDLYKVVKEDWADPVIRTCGETTRVKNIDVEKQLREPLALKYKEFLDENETGKPRQNILPDWIDDDDFQNYSRRVRESLHELNFKEINYILFCNKLSTEHRAADTLAFLQSVPWMAVFDLFDPRSREDGLYHVFNETSDSCQATFKELDMFKDGSPSDDCFTRNTTWIERSKSMLENDWTRYSKHPLSLAISACNERAPTGRIHCVFLFFSNEFIIEMADIIETAFAIIGNKAGKSITIMSEKKETVGKVLKQSKRNIRKEIEEQAHSGKPWQLLEEIFTRLVGPREFNKPDTKTNLPYFDGRHKAVLTKSLNSLTDLEIYLPEPKLNNTFEERAKAREEFFKGGKINQLNLFHHDDIERTLETKLTANVDRCLNNLSSNFELDCNVEVIQLLYESGSGATTLCRRILWMKRNTYRCAVVKAITSETDFQIEELRNFLYDHSRDSYIPPVLILVDNVSDQDVRQLLTKISGRKITCVVLNTVPISQSLDVVNKESSLELGQLDDIEIQKVKGILDNMTRDGEVPRDGAEKVLERDRRFLLLGLHLFGRKYQDVDKKVTKYINDMISQHLENRSVYEMILRFCCLLDYYSCRRCNYPHACITDLLHFDGTTNFISQLHEKFGGLLLETSDDRDGFRGWRPAHSLVGEIVRKQMDLTQTIKDFLVKMSEGYAYAKNYLYNHAVTVCLDRLTKTSSTMTSRDDLQDAMVIDDECGALEVRSRYSHLILDVIDIAENLRQGIENVLEILITLCKNVKTTPHKARAWQQIARVIAYELGADNVSNEGQIRYINEELRPHYNVKGSTSKGFEIAHVVIDEAIKLQDSHVHHFTAKGAFFLCELKLLEQRLSSSSQEITAVVKEAINTGKKGVDMYENALQKISRESYRYLDVLVGKFVAVVRLIEVLKCLPYFKRHDLGADESFYNCMDGKTGHEELSTIFGEEMSKYLVSLKDVAVDLSIDLSQEIRLVKLRRSDLSKKYVMQELRNAMSRALQITKTLYCLTGWTRTDLTDKGLYHELTSHSILSNHDETPFSTWKMLSDDDIKKIHSSLQPIIHNKMIMKKDASMLIFAKAMLHLQEKPTLHEFSVHVENWCKTFPKSVWANLFKYIIHFPFPNNSLNISQKILRESINICLEKSRSKQRRSAAEYLLGKATGLNAIVRPYEISPNSEEMYGTKFWRSPKVWERLQRLQGRKIAGRNGFLRYKEIEILFDNRRYPKDSNDDLWFCLGFTLSGPYAFDPIDKITYERLGSTLSHSSSSINDDDLCVAATSTRSIPMKHCSRSSSVLAGKVNSSQETRSATPQVVQSVSEHTINEKIKKIAGRNLDGEQLVFSCTGIDQFGRACHGVPVMGAKKSDNCRMAPGGHDMSKCNFAHWEKGDTLQHICTKCTKEGVNKCVHKKKHSPYIYNLGPYLNSSGERWKKHI